MRRIKNALIFKKQQFGTKKFRENPSNSWYYIFIHRYPDSALAKIIIEKYKVNNLERSNSDMIDQIGGWATAGVGQSYGKGSSIERLQRFMKKIVI